MLVINATGYESSELPLKDLKGKVLPLGRDPTDNIFLVNSFNDLLSKTVISIIERLMSKEGL